MIPAAPVGPPAAPGAPGAPEAVNPAALSVAQLARMLGVPPAKLQEHVDAGAPTGPDGSINLVHYAAWLNRELARPESAGGERAGPVERVQARPVAASVSAPLRRDRKPEAKTDGN